MNDQSHAKGTIDLDKIVRSVHRYTNDVIVISEAEPLDQPGPRIVFVNDAFVKHTGYSREEAVGQTPRILQGPDTCKETTDRIRKRLKLWMPVREQLVNYRKDGTPFWVELSIVPVADPTGWWTHWVSVQRDITEQKRREHSVEAERDELQVTLQGLARDHCLDGPTGLGDEHALMAWAAGRAPEDAVKLAVIQLNGLRQMKDTYGQETADAVTQELAQRLRDAVSMDDVAIRLSEREFAVASLDLDEPDTVGFGEALTLKLSEPVMHDGHPCSLSCRAGVARGQVRELRDGALVENARAACSRVDALQQPQVLSYGDDVADAVSEAQGLAKELGQAIVNHGLDVHLMPQVSAKTGEVTGYEALTRWIHPKHGMMMPSQFMPLAEQMNILPALDRVILQKAIAHQARLGRATGKDTPVSVNVSGESLFDEGYVSDLMNASLPSGAIALEIVEGAVLRGSDERALEALNKVRGCGYRIDLDDFGSGSSSIVGLTKLRPDRLKIDHRLTLPILDSMEKLKLAGAIISVGKALQIPLIAEGVQTEAHAKKLRNLGVDHLQGYFIGEAQSIESLGLV